MTPLQTVQKYYEYFNQKNWEGMLSLLHQEVRHETNQGEARIGIEKFTDFLKKMDESYDENLTEMIFFIEPSNQRIATEFIVNGIYKKAEDGLPMAYNQKYVLPAAAFLELKDGKIARITTYYNLTLWLELVSK